MAALGVFQTGSAWADQLVAGVVSGRMISGRSQIPRRAREELRAVAI